MPWLWLASIVMDGWTQKRSVAGGCLEGWASPPEFLAPHRDLSPHVEVVRKTANVNGFRRPVQLGLDLHETLLFPSSFPPILTSSRTGTNRLGAPRTCSLVCSPALESGDSLLRSKMRMFFPCMPRLHPDHSCASDCPGYTACSTSYRTLLEKLPVFACAGDDTAWKFRTRPPQSPAKDWALRTSLCVANITSHIASPAVVSWRHHFPSPQQWQLAHGLVDQRIPQWSSSC
jgi:hypothetical protein